MSGGGGHPEAAEDAEQLGFPAELVEELAKTGRFEVEVWEENWATVCAFGAVVTQWRVATGGDGRARFIGLDYSAVRTGLDAEGLEVTPEIWRGLRVMEGEACRALNGD